MDGDRLEAAVDAAFAPARRAIDAQQSPGAILGIVSASGDRAVRWAGHAAIVPERRTLDRDTWFDLASLTKVLATVPAVLRLCEAGRIDLDDPICRTIPDINQYDPQAPIRSLSLRSLLSHASGLPAVEPIYTWGNDPDTLRALILQRPWPLAAAVYSDINYMLLGLVVERLCGSAFPSLPAPPGCVLGPGPEQRQTQTFAATEACQWRGRVLCGETHDENAWALGGAAGHAGLFGPVDAVLDQALAHLQGTVMSPAALAELRRPHSETRALGWERRAPGWSGGSLCSPSTLGHTGFTGVGLWIDFERGAAWTLLTNRVHPTRHRETGIMDLRRAVGNLVAANWPRD